MIEVKGADSHETDCFEERHVHILSLVVVHCLIMGILPNHRHFALGHQVLHTLVNFTNH